MFGMKILDRHADLTGRMARALGVDVAKAFLDGDLTPEQYRGAVVSCTRCSNPRDCAAWLQVHGDGAAHAPEYCRNAALFARLPHGEGGGATKEEARPAA